MRKLYICFLVILFLFAVSACKKDEKKPFGAADISYDKVEEINKNGPSINDSVPENTPPMGSKVIVENGPWHLESSGENTPPIAESDPYGKFDDVPIYQPEHKE